MKQIIADMTQYSDTELRILLVITTTCEPLSMADLQRYTGRGRQVYTAVESLERRRILHRSPGVRHGEKTWFFQSVYTTLTTHAPPLEPEPEVIPETPVTVPPEPVIVETPTPTVIPEPVPVVPPPKRERKRKEREEVPPTAQQHPAVVAYVDITRRRPKQVVADQIAKMIPSAEVEKWRETVEHYVLNGWNPLNVANMIRMFQGQLAWKGNTGRQRGATVIPHQSPEQARSDWAAYLEDNE